MNPLLQLLAALQGPAMAQDKTIELDFSQPAQVQGPITLPQIYRAYQNETAKPTDVSIPQEIEKDIQKTQQVETKETSKPRTLFAQDVPRYALILKEAFPNLSDAAISGILGNFGHESLGFEKTQEINPKAGRGGLGIPQFTGPRRKQFESYLTKKYGEIPTDTAVIQDESLNYAIQELKSPEYANLLKNLSSVKNTKDAVITFEKSFERADPFKKHMSSRLLYAKQAENILKRFNKK